MADIKLVAAAKYKGMRDKCYNKNHPEYWKFGAKGARVCKEWLDSYQKFLQWAIDNKLTESKFLFRKDEDKDYSPENCFIGTLDEYSAFRGWKSYSYNDLHQLSGVLYNMPDLGTMLIVIEDDAFISSVETELFLGSELSKKVAAAAAKLEKDNAFFHFKKDVLLDDGTTKKAFSRRIYNSDDLEAIKPYLKEMSEEEFMKYSELISILEEWNEHAHFKASLAQPKKEETKVEEVIQDTPVDRNSTVIAPDKLELLTALMTMCSEREQSMPLNKLIRLVKIDAQIELLKQDKANIIKE